MASRTRFQNRSRSAGKITRRISHSLGRAHGRGAIDRLTGEMHELAKTALKQASRVLGNARRGLRHKPRGAAAVARLDIEVERAERVIKQTGRRLSGERAIADRMVSLCDPDARPIRRGRPQEPTEFGYKVSVADTAEGFVIAHEVYLGNPSDVSTLQRMVASAKAIGMKVRTVLADRGYGNEIGDQVLAGEGIKDKVIPRVGKADPVEATPAWRTDSALVARAGSVTSSGGVCGELG